MDEEFQCVARERQPPDWRIVATKRYPQLGDWRSRGSTALFLQGSKQPNISYRASIKVEFNSRVALSQLRPAV